MDRRTAGPYTFSIYLLQIIVVDKFPDILYQPPDAPGDHNQREKDT